MISNQGAGFAAPTGSAADFLGFANRLGAGIDSGMQAGTRMQRSIFDANRNAMDLGNQGTNELIADLTRSSDVYGGMSDNLEAQREFFMRQCAAGGGDPGECRRMFDTSVGRAPQNTQGPQQSVAPNMQPFNVNNFLGLS